MSKAVDVDTIDNVNLVFRAGGKNYAVDLSRANKALLFGSLLIVDGGLRAVQLSDEFAWEPIAKHVERGEG
jgi:hypothetical protein